MAKIDTLWTCVGITKHVSSSGKVVEKVRCGLDLVRRVKTSKSNNYIRSKGENLTEVRTEFFDTPNPMLRIEALRYALTIPEFQNENDQRLINIEIEKRMPKVKKQRKPRTVKNKKEISIDSIKQRMKKVTATDVLVAAGIN